MKQFCFGDAQILLFSGFSLITNMCVMEYSESGDAADHLKVLTVAEHAAKKIGRIVEELTLEEFQGGL